MKILKNILMCCVLVSFLACEDGTEFTKTGLDYVAFTVSSASVNEAVAVTTQDGISTTTNGYYTVNVIRSSSDVSADLTVNFTVAGTFVSTSDFADAGDDAASTFASSAAGSVVIPAGKSQAAFTITAINDLFSSGNKEVVVTITGASASNYQLGYAQSGLGESLTLTIIDDDCPIDLSTFAGTYSMASVGTEGAFNEGFDLCASAARDCSGDVTLTPIATDPTGTTATIDHASFGNPLQIKFITCSSEVIVENSMDTWFGNAWFTRQGDEVIGSYNDDSKGIVVVVDVANFDEFDIILTKN